jgi:hypothetical protein|tara:strand:+ start:1632 stop:1751 length:120 start_codon:yes stop_codon:yes gene_type:complete
MTNILELGVLFIFGGMCFAAGIYLATQLGDWINRQIKKK